MGSGARPHLHPAIHLLFLLSLAILLVSCADSSNSQPQYLLAQHNDLPTMVADDPHISQQRLLGFPGLAANRPSLGVFDGANMAILGNGGNLGQSLGTNLIVAFEFSWRRKNDGSVKIEDVVGFNQNVQFPCASLTDPTPPEPDDSEVGVTYFEVNVLIALTPPVVPEVPGPSVGFVESSQSCTAGAGNPTATEVADVTLDFSWMERTVPPTETDAQIDIVEVLPAPTAEQNLCEAVSLQRPTGDMTVGGEVLYFLNELINGTEVITAVRSPIEEVEPGNRGTSSFGITLLEGQNNTGLFVKTTTTPRQTCFGSAYAAMLPAEESDMTDVVFILADVDGDGALDLWELTQFTEIMYGVKLTDEEASAIFSALNTDGNGSISPQEFAFTLYPNFDPSQVTGPSSLNFSKDVIKAYEVEMLSNPLTSPPTTSSQPSSMPSTTSMPSPAPTLSARPSLRPSLVPSFGPSTSPSSKPSMTPSSDPTASPSSKPSTSQKPTHIPTSAPSSIPSSTPSASPSTKSTKAKSNSKSANDVFALADAAETVQRGKKGKKKVR